MIWTPSQQEAILALNSEILVSAAAGSGKTSVLVDRIVYLIEKGYDLKRMIIVTFTRNAAAEMRQRLHNHLKKLSLTDIRYRAPLQDLEQTQITTIHGFCEKLIRREFQHLDIDPLFSVLDEAEGKILFDEAARDALNELLEEENENLLKLSEAVGRETLLLWNSNLHTFLMSLPNPFVWLRQHIDGMTKGNMEDQPWYRSRENWIRLHLQNLKDLLDCEKSLCDEPAAIREKRKTVDGDVQYLEALEHCIELPIEKRAAYLKGVKPGDNKSLKIPPESAEWNERFKEVHSQFRKDGKELTENYLAVNPDFWPTEIFTEQAYLTGLADLTERTEKYFHEAKQKRELIDFSDMEQMTFAMLQDEKQAEEIRSRYDHLFIDECQDVSAVQDAIIQKLHRPEGSLFMVGDVKQSIYRFRRAEPKRFMERVQGFSDEKDAEQRRIFLQTNFRSAAPILDTTNEIFRQIMREDITEMNYLPEDELIVSETKTEGKPVTLLTVDAEDKSNKKVRLAADTRAVIGCIRRLVQPAEEGGEGYQYRDIAILMPKLVNRGSAVARMLETAGIPSFCDDTESYYDFPEVRALTEVLKLLDNTLQDLPLLTAMQLEPFGFDEHEIAAVSQCSTEKNRTFYQALLRCAEDETPLAERCRAFLKQIEAWRFEASFKPLAEMIWSIMEKTGLLGRAGALPNGKQRQANLRLLCEEADAFEQQQNGGLHDFLQSIEDSRTQGDKLGARLLSDQDNVVRIMTIHKSKGLEYPVVIVLGLGEGNSKPKGISLCMHPELGVSIPYYRQDLLIERNTARHQAFMDCIAMEEKSERVRQLYVAMTRAKERMILVLPGTAEEWRQPLPQTSIFMLNPMSDWIRMAIHRPGIRKIAWEFAEPEESEEEEKQQRSLEELWQQVQQRPASRVFPGPEAPKPAGRPSKTSVSSLIRMNNEAGSVPENEDAEETVADKAKPYGAMLLSELPARPGWLSEKKQTGAEFGTLMHRFMAAVDLDAVRSTVHLRDCLRSELQRLHEAHFFTDDEAAHINLNQAEGFFADSLGRQMLKADRVRREWHFNVRWDGGEAMLLQGVIDLAFRTDGVWTVIDYKTDRIEDEAAFVEQYRMQLQLYAGAVETITGEPVGALWLYALKKGRAYPVER